MNMRTKAGLGLLLAVFALGAYVLLQRSGMLATMLDAAVLQEHVAQLGPWGPVVIVALMTIAILISPIPSAPIALAAGAAYGHVWGALYVLLGAQVGAMAAFAIARVMGRDAVQRWFGERISIGLIGSQNALTGIVLISRLLPFLSFDIVSYAAGLTPLSFWRFSLATLVGIAPSSFLLAHFGTEMQSGEARRIAYAVLALGGLTLVPVGVKLYRNWRARRFRAKDASSE